MVTDRGAETRPNVGDRVSADVLPVLFRDIVSATYKNPRHLLANSQNSVTGILTEYRPVYFPNGEVFAERGIVKLKNPFSVIEMELL